jgi:hypothetical protein
MDILNLSLSGVGALSGAICIYLFNLFRNSAKVYVDEKARNLATIEDTARITAEIEAVKSKHEFSTHAKKQVFEREYELLQLVWRSTWEFQAMARSLRPIMDYLPEDKIKEENVLKERHAQYIESVNNFRDVVIKNKPFMPQNIYETCIELRGIVIKLQVDFESSFRVGGSPNWDRISECGDKLDSKLNDLSDAIRKCIYG